MRRVFRMSWLRGLAWRFSRRPVFSIFVSGGGFLPVRGGGRKLLFVTLAVVYFLFQGLGMAAGLVSPLVGCETGCCATESVGALE